jgi:hypothetical protein
MQEERSRVVDPNESSRSYVFGPSNLTVNRIQKLVSLHYFTEGDMREPREEVVPKPADDEVVVFEEFFHNRASHASHPTLTDICTCFECGFTS